MNNQNFYLRLIALLLIIMAVFFYNGTVKDKEQAQNIADLTAKTESLENQQKCDQTQIKILIIHVVSSPSFFYFAGYDICFWMKQNLIITNFKSVSFSYTKIYI